MTLLAGLGLGSSCQGNLMPVSAFTNGLEGRYPVITIFLPRQVQGQWPQIWTERRHMEKFYLWSSQVWVLWKLVSPKPCWLPGVCLSTEPKITGRCRNLKEVSSSPLDQNQLEGCSRWPW